MKNSVTAFAMICMFCTAVEAGNLDASGAPTAGSGMPTTTEIYNRLQTGVAASVPGAFQEPAAGPSSGTGRTLGEIAATLPVADNANGATAAHVVNGKTFWGLRTDGTWGMKSGTAAQASGTAVASDVLVGKTFSNTGATGIAGSMPNNGAVTMTPGTTAQPIAAGYHSGAGRVAGDTNLQPANIRSGVSIFGVAGTMTGLDMSHVSSLSCANKWIGSSCEICPNHWSGTSCDTCPSNWGGASCNVCGTGWGGASCDVCANGWTGASCNVCPAGWSGANCDTIAKPFPTTPPSYATIPWKCVTDTATGLTWEVKTSSGGLHNKNNSYSWNDRQTFVDAVNAEGLCGHTDWRMPSLGELQGLIVNGPSPTIDTAYFPNTLGASYWSGTDQNVLFAWNVFFYEGSSSSSNKSFPYFIRLVRP